MSNTPLAAAGMDALVMERAARKAAERARVKAQAEAKAANELAELWELRCKDTGRSLKWFKAEWKRYKEIHEQAQINNNIYAD
ncbi:hypothetical protein [Arthrobacter sp. H35-D1]|uniref:hypothetical protein n=1 Tax=Arthrobacter sp. H35-D1 TaxID=3046202 RepID=UPI0024BA2DB8|nr:hypothetical protein [Arthrobacter sp. H35-D1]MDJ0311679.1 hypothetical protein [Arthrobacter sp. H35-D1]